jgi:hypothetical protein
MKEFKRILKPGGYFIALHEPTPAAIALESSNIRLLLKYLLKGVRYIDDIRYKGADIAPGGGADIWLFEKDDLLPILYELGFEKIVHRDWHLMRPFVVAKFKMHLKAEKPTLTRMEKCIFKFSILLDNFFSLTLPSRLFGSFCLAAKKSIKVE